MKHLKRIYIYIYIYIYVYICLFHFLFASVTEISFPEAINGLQIGRTIPQSFNFLLRASASKAFDRPQ